MRSRRLMATTLVVCLGVLLTSVTPTTAVAIAPSGLLDHPLSTGTGGRTMLVEEVTATWCPSCAEIDPELVRVADSHGSRIALIALHPSDGEDDFQPPASQYRIDRINALRDEPVVSTPTFVVEGGEARVGYEAWTDVQRDILSTELERDGMSELAFTVTPENDMFRVTLNELRLVDSPGTQLTYMVLEHDKQVSSSSTNPGGPTRDRVLVGIAECAVDSGTVTEHLGLVNATTADGCEHDFSVVFNATEHWSVVLVHEHINNNGTTPSDASLGAVELAYRPISSSSSDDFSLWVLATCGVIGIAALYRKV